MFGLGKKRSKYGEFLDNHDVAQERVREYTKLNRETVSIACNDRDYIPSGNTMRKLLNAARELTGKDVEASDFWRL